MVIQWCLKGISERPAFSNTEAEALLGTGIKSKLAVQQSDDVD